MQIVIDMNLSPTWCDFFNHHGHEALHWQQIASPSAPDHEIMAWATEHKYVVFTHDLDFGIILALTGASKPSVIQLREREVAPRIVGDAVVAAINQFRDELNEGALITVERHRQRVRVLPIQP